MKDEPSGLGLGQGMMDRSRLALCVFMLGVLAFNPFNLLFASQLQGPVADTSGHTGRTLQGFEEEPGQGVWVAHTVIISGGCYDYLWK